MALIIDRGKERDRVHRIAAQLNRIPSREALIADAAMRIVDAEQDRDSNFKQLCLLRNELKGIEAYRNSRKA